MPAPRVRTDHTQLNQISQTFQREADQTKQMIQSIRRSMDVLQGGDWIGKGATAFYQEMQSSVMPSLQRLASALDAASKATRTIGQVMKQAEGEASGKLDGHEMAAGGSTR